MGDILKIQETTLFRNQTMKCRNRKLLVSTALGLLLTTGILSTANLTVEKARATEGTAVAPVGEVEQLKVRLTQIETDMARIEAEVTWRSSEPTNPYQAEVMERLEEALTQEVQQNRIQLQRDIEDAVKRGVVQGDAVRELGDRIERAGIDAARIRGELGVYQHRLEQTPVRSGAVGKLVASTEGVAQLGDEVNSIQAEINRFQNEYYKVRDRLRAIERNQEGKEGLRSIKEATEEQQRSLEAVVRQLEQAQEASKSQLEATKRSGDITTRERFELVDEELKAKREALQRQIQQIKELRSRTVAAGHGPETSPLRRVIGERDSFERMESMTDTLEDRINEFEAKLDNERGAGRTKTYSYESALFQLEQDLDALRSIAERYDELIREGSVIESRYSGLRARLTRLIESTDSIVEKYKVKPEVTKAGKGKSRKRSSSPHGDGSSAYYGHGSGSSAYGSGTYGSSGTYGGRYGSSSTYGRPYSGGYGSSSTYGSGSYGGSGTYGYDSGAYVGSGAYGGVPGGNPPTDDDH
jgi:chromosome segregation ATPase